MLPYSAVAAIDYAAYQSRPGLSNGAQFGASFTHSWLVPPAQDLCNVNFTQQPNETGHVEIKLIIKQPKGLLLLHVNYD